jgi:hypothetical protein
MTPEVRGKAKRAVIASSFGSKRETGREKVRDLRVARTSFGHSRRYHQLILASSWLYASVKSANRLAELLKNPSRRGSHLSP